MKLFFSNLLFIFCLNNPADAQMLPDSALSFNTNKWWTIKDIDNLNKGDMSSILHQFDLYHKGYLKETELQNQYNNFYLGNGQLGMFVDALGAQALPYIIDSANLEYPQFADRDAIDVSIGQYKSDELQSDKYHYGTSQQPTINYNESWVKTKWHEHGNTYGRGHLSIRNSIFPTIDKIFEANTHTISKYTQRMDLWNNSCITGFTYKNQLQVQITSYTHWAHNRVTVFHYEIKNISAKPVDAGCVAEPFVSYHNQKFNFSIVKKGLALHLKEDWLLHDLYKRYASFLSDSRKKSRDSKLYIFDTTTISLFQEVLRTSGKNPSGKRKDGIKVHTLIRSDQDVPCMIRYSAAAANDSQFLKEVYLPKGSILVFDRGYHDYKTLNRFANDNITWVTRRRKQLTYKVLQGYKKTDDNETIISDEQIQLGWRSGTKVKACIN